MQVNIEDISTVKKNIHFEIPSKDVDKELDKAYKELKKNASIKGFRKGKIPRAVLESRFGKDVHADISPRMIQEAFVEMLDEHKFEVLGEPKFTPEKPLIEAGKDFVFNIELEIRPELEEIEFKGLELKKNLYRVTDEEMNAQLNMIQKNFSTKETITEERPVKGSDFVLIDYQGFVDDQPFDATPKVENYVMAIGGKALPEVFSTKLTGVIPPHELEIEAVYPEDEANEALRGKTVLYKVALKEIQEEILPALDDELAKKLGSYTSLDELKKTISDNLEKGIEKRVQQELSEQIYEQLLEKYQFEVPDALVESELKGIIAEAQQSFAQNNVTLEQVGLSEESIRDMSKDVALQQAKRHLVLGKIIDQEALELSEEDLNALYESMGVAMGGTADAIKNFFDKSPQQFEYVKYYELEKKATRLIIDEANVVDVEPEIEDNVAKSPDVEADSGE